MLKKKKKTQDLLGCNCERGIRKALINRTVKRNTCRVLLESKEVFLDWANISNSSAKEEFFEAAWSLSCKSKVNYVLHKLIKYCRMNFLNE